MCAVGESNAGWIEVCRVVDSLFIYFLIFFFAHESSSGTCDKINIQMNSGDGTIELLWGVFGGY